MNADNVILMSTIATLGSTTAATVLPHRIPRSKHVPKAGERLPPGRDSDTICVAGELPSFKLLFGTTLVFAGLGMAGTFAPKMAAMFSVLLAFTALTYYGFPILGEVFGKGLCKP